MSSAFTQLLFMNLRLIYRNRTGMFFTLVMPLIIYTALSILPIGRFMGSEINYSDFVLPGIIALTIMQGGIYGLAYWFIDLKTRNVVKRFLVTPLKQAEFIGSVLVSRIIIALLQLVLLTAVGWWFFGASISGNIIFAFGFGILGSAIFLLAGLLIATFADSYEAAAPVTAAVGLPLTFLGNIFYPISSLPPILRHIAELLPVTYLTDGIRSVYLNSGTWADWGADAGMLLVWLAVMIALNIWLFRLKP